MTDSRNQVGQKETLENWLGVNRGSLALAFTDIVGSTETAIGMGDRAWIEVLIKHFAKARHYTDLNGGYEVKLIGDACMVAFRTADAALEFAMAFLGDTGDPGIRIRAGIHVGEVRVLENDIHGTMVNYTSRVQHAMRESGIAVSTNAKTQIEYEWGRNILGRFEIRQLSLEEPLKGFPENQQTLWQIIPTAPAITGQKRQLSKEYVEYVEGSGWRKVAHAAEPAATSAGIAASVADSKAGSVPRRIDTVTEYLDPELELMHFAFDDVGKNERDKYVRVGRGFTGEVFQAAILDFRLKPVRDAVPWVEVRAHILFKDRENHETRVGAGVWHGRDQAKVPMRPGETQSLILTGGCLSKDSQFSTYEHGPRGDEDHRIERMLEGGDIRICVGLIAEYMSAPRSDNAWFFKLSKSTPEGSPKIDLIKPKDFERKLRRPRNNK